MIAVFLIMAGAFIGSPAGAAASLPEFEFLGQKLDGDFLTMDYRLPFGGVVEVRVFSADGELVWQNQYINPRGENRIRLKAEAFATGSTYTVQLNYKTDEYKLLVERK